MKKIILFIVLIIAMLLVSHFVFERADLYYEFLWLDIPMHALGGFLLAGLFISTARFTKQELSLALLLSLFFIVASAWELYEYFLREITERSWYGFFDSVKDYAVGAIGVLAGYRYLLKR